MSLGKLCHCALGIFWLYRRQRVAAPLALALIFAQPVLCDGSPEIRLNPGHSGHPTFVVVGWDGIEGLKSESSGFTLEQWRRLFSIYVASGPSAEPSAVPPLLGSYRIEGEALIFEPRFPLTLGLSYRAVFSASTVAQPSEVTLGATVKTFYLPKPETIPSTVVEHVYPSTDRLPENQLKFYLHFSAPMSRGEAYRRIHLLDETGRELELPFLELEQELWDPAGKRLTIFFDPGRIKRGLAPHEEVGAPLKDGKTYSFAIDRDWLDANGEPLREAFRKSFRVGPPDREPPRLDGWSLSPPKAGSRQPLTVEFPEPMDHALVIRLVDVTNLAGTALDGSSRLDRDETRWQFTPGETWKAGEYYLQVGTTLEDLAGNTIDRPFEVDVFQRVEERIVEETRRIPFKVAPASRPR